MAARDSKGRFLPRGSSGGSSDSSGAGGGTAADDAAGVLAGLGLAGNAATEFNDILSALQSNAAASVSSIADHFSGLGSVSSGLSGALEGLSGKADWLHAFGASAQQIESVKDGLGGVAEILGPIAAEADVVVAVLGALAEKLYGLAEAAVALTQEKDAIRATFDVFTGDQGDALLDGLEDIAATLPYTGDKLNAWAKSLIGAVGPGEKLETALRAVAAANAIMGESGGAAAESLIKRFALMAETGQKVSLDRKILTQLAAAGVSVKALADALGVAPEKLGEMKIAAGDLGAAMQKALIANGAKSLSVMGDTWTSISAKLTEGWEDAFEDLGDIVGPFMSQLRGLASEFFAGSIASGTLKGGIKDILTPAFEVATRTVRAAHIALLNIEIAYLKVRIAILPLTSALDGLGVSSGIVNVAMYLIGATALILAVVFGVLALAVFLVALPFIVAGAAIYGLYQAIVYLIGIIGGVSDHFDQLSGTVSNWASDLLGAVVSAVAGIPGALLEMATGAASAAGDFVSGLVGGISSGAGAVADAVKNLASGALKSFTSFFGIASPSKVMKEHGKKNIAEDALAAGIDEGADEVDRAMEDLASPPKGKGSGGRRGGGGGDRVFAPTFTNCVFGGGMTKAQLWTWLDEWWEQQASSGPEPEPAS